MKFIVKEKSWHHLSFLQKILKLLVILWYYIHIICYIVLYFGIFCLCYISYYIYTYIYIKCFTCEHVKKKLSPNFFTHTLKRCYEDLMSFNALHNWIKCWYLDSSFIFHSKLNDFILRIVLIVQTWARWEFLK